MAAKFAAAGYILIEDAIARGDLDSLKRELEEVVAAAAAEATADGGASDSAASGARPSRQSTYAFERDASGALSLPRRVHKARAPPAARRAVKRALASPRLGPSRAASGWRAQASRVAAPAAGSGARCSARPRRRLVARRELCQLHLDRRRGAPRALSTTSRPDAPRVVRVWGARVLLRVTPTRRGLRAGIPSDATMAFRACSSTRMALSGPTLTMLNGWCYR